tara:strand:- start:649 stop:1707 length:1059 start_codon:yes stop_codon:yes gene_type:complete
MVFGFRRDEQPDENPVVQVSAAKRHELGSAVALMEQEGALFDVLYPPARYWDEQGSGTTVDEFPIPLDDSGRETRPIAKWVVRADTGAPLGLHSGSYPEQGSYRYLAEMADKMFPGTADSVTLWGNGERVCLTQTLAEPIDLGGGDKIKPQIVWVSSFNGKWATTVYHLMNRLFCQNQLITPNALLKVRHSPRHDQLLNIRASVLEATIHRAEIMANMARTFKDRAFTNEQFEDLVSRIVPDPPKDEEGHQNQNSLNAMTSKRTAMRNAWERECTGWGKIETILNNEGKEVPVRYHGDRWLAYNAIQGAEQHQINAGYDDTEDARKMSLRRAIDGGTRLTDKAQLILAGGSI